MVDPENEVRSRIASDVRREFPHADVVGEYVKSPASFPHISIVMADNPVVASRTSGAKEMTRPMFEVNVFSNKTGGKKSECKQIMQVIDSRMFSMNFRRLSCTPVPNLENATIYRLVARYTALTDGNNFYRS